jgi:phenylalanyl-tRNA synthetase alpha chain
MRFSTLRIVLFAIAFSSREQQPLAFTAVPSISTHGRNNIIHVGPRENNRVAFGIRLYADTTKDEQEIISIDAVSEKLRQLQATIDQRLAEAKGTADTEALRREYLGKKGPINEIMGYMRSLSSEDKPKLGVVVNQVKSSVETAIQERMASLQVEEIERQMEDERVDVTQPGVMQFEDIGRRHPLSMTMEKAVDVFTRLGYDTVTDVDNSPEIESDFYCFEALNCPKDHPARDMQDTFYLTQDREMLLRTHTSSVQIRHLEKNKPPLRIVAPGRVYRRDDIDATHSLIFHQVEILALEKRGELTIGHLKGTVEHFLKNMFGPDIKLRFRGSYFPFTEPSMEVDVFFRGKWLEVLGCGMVDPNVLEMAGVDPNEYTGFAAGFGIERFAMVIHGITDIREFYKNDKRFLQQFPHFYDDGKSSPAITLRAYNLLRDYFLC